MNRVAKTLFHRYTGSPRAFPVLASVYPPLLGSGIRIRSIAPDWTHGELSMHVAPWTANSNGTAFGGSLFSATDVLYGSLLAGQLGGQFQVWTKTATIDFHKPGRGRLHCTVEVPRREAEWIREQLVDSHSTSVVHTARILDRSDEIVVEATHTMCIRRKRRLAA